MVGRILIFRWSFGPLDYMEAQVVGLLETQGLSSQLIFADRSRLEIIPIAFRMYVYSIRIASSSSCGTTTVCELLTKLQTSPLRRGAIAMRTACHLELLLVKLIQLGTSRGSHDEPCCL